MKGKFSNETAERLYDEWNDGRHDGEAYDGWAWYVLFVCGDDSGYILSEDEQGFVNVTDYPNGAIMPAWRCCVAAADAWDDMTEVE